MSSIPGTSVTDVLETGRVVAHMLTLLGKYDCDVVTLNVDLFKPWCLS